MPAKSVAVSTNTSGDNTLVAADSLRPIYVTSVTLYAGGTVSVKFTDGTTDVTGTIPIGTASTNIPWVQSAEMYGICKVDAGKALILNLSAGVAVNGVVTYFIGELPSAAA